MGAEIRRFHNIDADSRIENNYTYFINKNYLFSREQTIHYF